jgi:hypothetical protein
MIHETIVSTQNVAGVTHLAPMGIHHHVEGYLIMPFRPSTTLDNLLDTHCAVINYSDDVRVFAGCMTGRHDWPLRAAEKIPGMYLADTLAHVEVQLTRYENDAVRPKLFCKAVHSVNHAPFQGFNRAQFSVLEAAILVSRLGLLRWDKIEAELAYLRIGLEKTAGERELQAWSWLMQHIESHKQEEKQRIEFETQAEAHS